MDYVNPYKMTFAWRKNIKKCGCKILIVRHQRYYASSRCVFFAHIFNVFSGHLI